MSNQTQRRAGSFIAPVARRFRRWQRRLYRRHPWARRAVNIAAASACLLLVLALAVNAIVAALPKSPRAPEVEIAAPPIDTLINPAVTATAAATDIPTAEPTAAPTAVPVPTMETAPDPMAKPGDGLDASVYAQLAAPAADYADPKTNGLLKGIKTYSESDSLFQTTEEIHMGSSAAYTTLQGVTTFRGSNYRDGGGYGVIPDAPSRLFVMWKKRISGLDDWSGVGWTGQAGVVRWPADLREKMNIVRAKKDKSGLIEAIYATLDGHIYFLDLEDGQETRSPINIGAPIKGSLTIDPRGMPLLYCGQGIYDVNGRRVPCGTRIWSLIDQKLLYFLDGNDSKALRAWRAFDCSPLVDGATDTMITAGENGVLYKVKLNSVIANGSVSVSPTVDRYVYQQTSGGKLGTENSVAVYNNYAYFATNIGIIQCVDLNSMQLVWSFDARDDIDASLVIEPEGDGAVALYATNELDKRGHYGKCQMFKLNALTGELLWVRDSDSISQNNENGGGGFATPAVGKQGLSNLVYFHICRTEDSHGMLYALDKQTGEIAWEKRMGSYGWSSPTCVYNADGKGYVLVGSSSGRLRLLDGLTGETVAETELRGNIEGSPVVFDDMIIVGTRENYIYGLRIV